MWFPKNHRGGTDVKHDVEPQKVTMEEFISTTISFEHQWWMTETHLTPWVEWEILHPQLPILRITAHADQKLPLRPAGLESDPQDRYTTSYSVSFVISLQNR